MTTATSTTPLASKSLIFQNPNHHRAFLNPTTHYLRLPKNSSLTSKPRPLTLTPHLRISASTSSQPQSPLIKPNSTRTISIFIALAATASAAILSTIRQLGLKLKSICVTPTPEEMANLHSLREALTCTVGPMFFAAIRSRPSGALNTPLTVVAAGLSKWLDIYSGVLLVRVLLSWFPNIPWDRRYLSAIRDLCDPFLNLFRNIVPPVFDAFDVSPMLAFAFLGALESLLNNIRGV